MAASLVLSNAFFTQYFLKEETITFCDNSAKDKIFDFYEWVNHNRMSFNNPIKQIWQCIRDKLGEINNFGERIFSFIYLQKSANFSFAEFFLRIFWHRLVYGWLFTEKSYSRLTRLNIRYIHSYPTIRQIISKSHVFKNVISIYFLRF